MSKYYIKLKDGKWVYRTNDPVHHRNYYYGIVEHKDHATMFEGDIHFNRVKSLFAPLDPIKIAHKTPFPAVDFNWLMFDNGKYAVTSAYSQSALDAIAIRFCQPTKSNFVIYDYQNEFSVFLWPHTVVVLRKNTNEYVKYSLKLDGMSINSGSLG